MLDAANKLKEICGDTEELEKLQYREKQIESIIKKHESTNALHKFPGAQPVSFQENHCDMLQDVQTLVCEKTDGVRFFLIETDTGIFYTVDRKYQAVR